MNFSPRLHQTTNNAVAGRDRTTDLRPSQDDDEGFDDRQRGAVARPSALRAEWRPRPAAFRWRFPVTLFIALAPVAATSIYLFWFATPMFAAEARFVLRSADASAMSGGIPSFLASGNGVATAFVEGYAVRDYILSREAMERLNGKIDFIRLMTKADADPLVRLRPDASRDEEYSLYRSAIQARFNIVEQMVVLKVYAFSPTDAQSIARGLIGLAENFSDDMNRRARADGLKVAQQEVTRAEERATRARLAVQKWRNENANIDPTIDVKTIADLISQLELQLLAADADLDQIRTSKELNNPRRASLEVRVKTIRRQIAETRSRMIGGGATPEQLARYEVVRMEQEFADKNLDAARQSLEQARVSTVRQQRYISVVTEPIAGERRAYPDRIVWLGAAALAGCLLAFLVSILRGLLEDMRPRREPLTAGAIRARSEIDESIDSQGTQKIVKKAPPTAALIASRGPT